MDTGERDVVDRRDRNRIRDFDGRESEKSARARGSYLRVSFKNTRETAQAINGWKLQRAVAYLENVMEHKEAVPMRRYAGSTGRCAQGELDIQFPLSQQYLAVQ